MSGRGDAIETSSTAGLRLAHCAACGGYTYPPTAYGCRVCGAAGERLDAVPPPGALHLRNFVTLHAELVPGLPVPCVIGEVELAPGVVEEALIDVADEAALRLDMPLEAVAAADEGAAARWRFRPADGAAR